MSLAQGRVAKCVRKPSRLGLKRMVVLSTPEQSVQADEIANLLGPGAAEVFTGAMMHTPIEVNEAAVAFVSDADGVVAIGGGSTTGLSKAIALRTDLPQIAIPTTYAGSEMTPILGETNGGRKTTQSTLKVLPEVVIYDIDLTLTLPPALSATSGMNAIAHTVEALYAKGKNPIISLMASEGIAALARALPRIVKQPNEVGARSDALYALRRLPGYSRHSASSRAQPCPRWHFQSAARGDAHHHPAALRCL